MALPWNPGVYRNSSFSAFPLPVTTFKIKDSWDVEEAKIPLKPGGETHGNSFHMPTIVVEGQIGMYGGTAQMTDLQMFEVYSVLRNFYDPGVTPETRFELFFFYDQGTSTYRKFKNVYIKEANVDMGDDVHEIFPYSFEFCAEDPAIYNTAPGA